MTSLIHCNTARIFPTLTWLKGHTIVSVSNDRIFDDNVITAVGIPTIGVMSGVAAAAGRSDCDIAIDHICTFVDLLLEHLSKDTCACNGV